MSLVINLIADDSVAAAPSGFGPTLRAAADLLQQAISDSITINIRYGWGSYNNVRDNDLIGGTGAEGGPIGGDNFSYATVRNWLTASATSAEDMTAVASLPATSASLPSGGNSIFVASAQEKALGHFSGNSNAVDGAIGFGTSSSSSFWFGATLHEITHAMGRVAGYSPPPEILDLFRYSSRGVYQWVGGRQAYFSIDGGSTRLANFGFTSDFGDFNNDSFTVNDPFAERVSSSATSLTALDLTVMDVIGFRIVGSGPLRFVATGDTDANGRSDIVYGSGGNIVLWLNGNSGFTQSTVANASMGAEWTAFGAADFNNDRRSDVLWTNNSGQVTVWLLSGATLRGTGTPSGRMGAEWRAAATGDFNGDGNADIFWVSNAGNATVWSMSATTLGGVGTVPGNMGAEWSVATTGDFNGDRNADVLWLSTSGDVTAWMLSGSNLAGLNTAVGHMGAEWRTAGTGDFNGDAIADIVWVDNSNNVQVWTMGGGAQIRQIVQVNGREGLEWHLSGVGDFTGDARSDLLWLRNDGAAHVWQLSGATVTSVSTPSTPTTAGLIGLSASPESAQPQLLGSSFA